MPRLSLFAAGIAAGAILAATTAVTAQEQRYGFGEKATSEQIAGWDIDARPPGEGLPEGSGSVSAGREIYSNTCVACHGQEGEGGMDRLVGGKGSLDTDEPVRTVGSYWPYATTLFDYIRRTMPFDNPHSLSEDELYAVTAYVLHMNDLVPEDATMDSESLPEVEMPNKDAFFSPDPRPDVDNTPCMNNCAPLFPEAGKEGQPSPSQTQ